MVGVGIAGLIAVGGLAAGPIAASGRPDPGRAIAAAGPRLAGPAGEVAGPASSGGTFFVADGQLFAGNAPNNLHFSVSVLDVATGRLVRTLDGKADAFVVPRPAGAGSGDVFVMDDGNAYGGAGMTTFQAATGKLLWTSSSPAAGFGNTHGPVCLAVSGGDLYVMEAPDQGYAGPRRPGRRDGRARGRT